MAVSADLYAGSLNISVLTLNDDLRKGSRFNIEVETIYGVFEYNNVNNGDRLVDWSRRNFRVYIPDWVRPEDITGGRISYESGSCFLCSQDNWTMGYVGVELVGSGRVLYKGYHRFTGGSPQTRLYD